MEQSSNVKPECNTKTAKKERAAAGHWICFENMALTGDHLIEFGRLKERERAEKEMNEMELERDVAKQERDATIQEFNTATQKLEEAFDTIDSLKKSIALLESELAKSQKQSTSD